MLAAAFLLGVALFLVDLQLPLGVAAGVPYVGVVLLSLWLPGRRFVVYITAASTALTVVGYYLSQPAGVYWMVIAKSQPGYQRPMDNSGPYTAIQDGARTKARY